MVNPEFKLKIKTQCLTLLEQKLILLEDALKSVTEAANNETKSSAGDKHETGRAIMQLEQEKLGKQINELREQIEELNKINTSTMHSDVICKGCLVQTQNAFIYIATGIGRIIVDGEAIYVISEASPLGKKLAGLKSGDEIQLNGTYYRIISIQ